MNINVFGTKASYLAYCIAYSQRGYIYVMGYVYLILIVIVLFYSTLELNRFHLQQMQM